MLKKRLHYTYEDYEDGNKGAADVVPEILADPEFGQVESLEIGSWGEAWDESSQAVIDDIVAHQAEFAHLKELAIGIMDYEDCEISWIIQGDYSSLWAALPNLKSLTIKGSSALILGDIVHDQLEALEIQCGGLPIEVIKSIAQAKLPNLRKLVLYLGVEDYGFDGELEDIREMLAQMDFPKLEYLGLVDSDMQDAVTEVVLASKYMPQLTTLELSMGTLTDEGGELLLEAIPRFGQLQKLDVHFHYMSEGMVKRLQALSLTVDASEANLPDEDDGDVYYYPMITE